MFQLILFSDAPEYSPLRALSLPALAGTGFLAGKTPSR